MTKRRGIAILVVAVIVAAVVWGFLRHERNQELLAIKSRLSGAELLADKQLLSQPDLIRTSTVRTWVFSIDDGQLNPLLVRCRDLEGQFGNLQVGGPLGCVAAFYVDLSEYRYLTLQVHPHTAEVSALYLSESEIAATVRPIPKAGTETDVDLDAPTSSNQGRKGWIHRLPPG